MTDKKQGLLIDYEFCTGCHSCEVACREEHGFGIGTYGIKIVEDGPRLTDPDNNQKKYTWRYIAWPTELCDLCADRVAMGKRPTCVHHCQASVLAFGTIEELLPEIMRKPQQALFFPTGEREDQWALLQELREKNRAIADGMKQDYSTAGESVDTDWQNAVVDGRTREDLERLIETYGLVIKDDESGVTWSGDRYPDKQALAYIKTNTAGIMKILKERA